MKKAASRAGGMDFGSWRPWLSAAAALVCLAAVGACGDDEGPQVLPGVNPGPNPAGSCNFASQGTCDEYAEIDAHPGIADGCASAGGIWSSGSCPMEQRNGVCMATSPATRTYSYSDAAAESLKGSCDKFIPIKVTMSRGMYARSGAGGGSAGRAAAGAGAGSGGSGGSAGAEGGSGGEAGGSGGSGGSGGAGGNAGDASGSGGGGGTGGMDN